MVFLSASGWINTYWYSEKEIWCMGGDIADYLDEEIVPYEELDESEKAACQMAAFLISGMILVIAGIVIPLF